MVDIEEGRKYFLNRIEELRNRIDDATGEIEQIQWVLKGGSYKDETLSKADKEEGQDLNDMEISN